MLEIKQAMELIQDSTKGYIYTHNMGYEIAFGLDRDMKWKLRTINEGDWTYFSISEVIEFLNFYMIDLYRFQTELNQALLTEVLYLNMRTCKLTDALGTELIDKAIADWAKFGDTLGKLINKSIVKSKLTIIKGLNNENN